MGVLAIRYRPEPIRSLAAASIVAGYTAIGTPMAHPIRQFFLENLTDVQVMFSFDGVNDHLTLISNTFFLSDITSNTSIQGASFALAQGDTIYVKRVGVPTTGSVYLSVFYASES